MNGPEEMETGILDALGNDFGLIAAWAAENHLEECHAADFHEENTGEDISPASAPFDGCTTCVVREVLHIAWPILREAALNGAPE